VPAGVKRTMMRRAVRNMLSAVGRGHGVTMVEVDRWTLAEELWSFGEDALCQAPLEMSDEDMVRLWVRAGELYLRDEARSAGEAAALAAVSVIEGKRRPLARKRRRPRAQLERFEQTLEERSSDVERIEDSDAFPDAWR
jgi:hypothetical protein